LSISKKKTVLVAEDEKPIRDILKIHLEKNGYNVILTENGERAIDVLKSEEISVAVTDIKMPIIDGFGVLDYVNKNCAQIPVIMLTGYIDVETAVDAMKKGSVDYLTKPIKRDDLLTSIEFALERQDPESSLKPFKPSQVYMLKDDGTLIHHYNITGTLEMDSDIFGSMFTAIKMFLKVSFRQDEELKTIDHGRFKILIEEGGNFFLVVIGHGEQIKSTRKKMAQITKKIEEKYGKYLSDWTGSIDEFHGIEEEFKILT
jgi:DNA-binding response OmpR family regulator